MEDRLTIVCEYSCPRCHVKEAKVIVPAREDEEVLDWIKEMMAALMANHEFRNPKCDTTALNVSIPLMHPTDKVGGVTIQ